MSFIRFITRPESHWKVFPVILLLFYGFLPVLFGYLFDATIYFINLSKIACLSSVALLIGGYASNKFYTAQLTEYKHREKLLYMTSIMFMLFVALTIGTASNIPILEALSGAGKYEISVSREEFLKARTGWQSALVYFHTLFTGSLLPYVLIAAFSLNRKYKYAILISFVVYSLIFMEKVFFIKWGMPLFVFYLFYKSGGAKVAKNLAVIMMILLSINIVLSGYTNRGTQDSLNPSSFISKSYGFKTGFDFFLWRSVAVPIFTASDSLLVFETIYNNEYLLGATNGTLATIFGLERIRFERDVFAAQFGQADDGTGSSNAVYFVEAYINFGLLGVIVISVLSGAITAIIGNGPNIALRSLTPLFSFSIFSGGFLGVLLSNGFLVLFVYIFLIRRVSLGTSNE